MNLSNFPDKDGGSRRINFFQISPGMNTVLETPLYLKNRRGKGGASGEAMEVEEKDYRPDVKLLGQPIEEILK